jgi:WD40 repeat protein
LFLQTAPVTRAIIAPDGKTVLTTCEDGIGRLWNMSTGRLVKVLAGHKDAILHAAFSPDGRSILTAGRDATARLWDGEQGCELRVLRGHEGAVVHAAFSPEGRRVVTSSEDTTARLWDLRTGEHLVLRHDQLVLQAVFDQRGELVATASVGSRIWDAVTGKELSFHRGIGAFVNSVAFSPWDPILLTASYDGTAQLLRWRGGSAPTVLTPKADNALKNSTSAFFDPEEDRILTTGEDRTARIWDIVGTELRVLRGHSGPVNHAAFRRDGRRIVTASADGTARAWDGDSGTELAVFLGHSDAVVHVAYAPDGARIVTASRDGTARIWDAGTRERLESQGSELTDRLLMFAESRLPISLTKTQRESWLAPIRR